MIKFASLAVAATLISGSNAFVPHATSSARVGSTSVKAFRQAYQHALEQLKQEQESSILTFVTPGPSFDLYSPPTVVTSAGPKAKKIEAKKPVLGHGIHNYLSDLESQVRMMQVEYGQHTRALKKTIGGEVSELVDAHAESRQARDNAAQLQRAIRAGGFPAGNEQQLKDEVASLTKKLDLEMSNAAVAQLTIKRIKDALKNEEQKLRSRVGRMSNEVNNMRLEAHREKMELINAHEEREEALKRQMTALTREVERLKIRGPHTYVDGTGGWTGSYFR